MSGNESDFLHYAMRLTFGLVHAVLLTLITFGLLVWVPSFSQWSFAQFGLWIVPSLSYLIACMCSACVLYVCEGTCNIPATLKASWIPPVGIACVSLFILPLELVKGIVIGPFTTILATSICMNAITVWILQMVSSQRVLRYASASSSGGPSPT